MVSRSGAASSTCASVAGKRGSPNTAAYNAANFGIQGLTQSLAMEVARHGVTVNAVCPGTIDTARMDVLGRGDGWQRQLDRIPMGRAASDEEVAGLIGVPVLAGRGVHDRAVDQYRRRRGDVVTGAAGIRRWRGGRAAG